MTVALLLIIQILAYGGTFAAGYASGHFGMLDYTPHPKVIVLEASDEMYRFAHPKTPLPAKFELATPEEP